MRLGLIILFAISSVTPARALDPFAGVEAELRQYKVEHAVCFDPYTYATQWRGTDNHVNQVRLHPYWCYQTIMTHNHPVQPYFSLEDLRVGITLKLRQLRAVGWLHGKPYTCALDNPAEAEPRLKNAGAILQRYGYRRGWDLLLQGLNYRCWYA